MLLLLIHLFSFLGKKSQNQRKGPLFVPNSIEKAAEPQWVTSLRTFVELLFFNRKGFFFALVEEFDFSHDFIRDEGE